MRAATSKCCARAFQEAQLRRLLKQIVVLKKYLVGQSYFSAPRTALDEASNLSSKRRADEIYKERIEGIFERRHA